MDNEQLYHWGIKGMKWGRRLYQNKDGSLTPLGRIRYRDPKARAQIKRQATVEAKKQATKTAAEEKAELEAKRAKLLKSSDAAELYENRNLLSTDEINERINRINTEKRLKDLVPETKSKGQAFVEGLKKVSGTANELYKLTETPIGKALKKKLGLEKGEETKEFNLESIYKNRYKLSDAQVKSASERIRNMNDIEKEFEKRKKDEDSSDSKKSDPKTETKTDSKSKDESKSESKKETKTASNKDSKSETKSGATGVKGSKWEKRKAESVDGEIVGEGTSHKTFTEKHSKTKKQPEQKTYFYDADTVDTGSEFVNKAIATIGPKVKINGSTKSVITTASQDMWKEAGSEIVSDIGPDIVEAINVGRNYYTKYIDSKAYNIAVPKPAKNVVIKGINDKNRK